MSPGEFGIGSRSNHNPKAQRHVLDLTYLACAKTLRIPKPHVGELPQAMNIYIFSRTYVFSICGDRKLSLNVEVELKWFEERRSLVRLHPDSESFIVWGHTQLCG